MKKESFSPQQKKQIIILLFSLLFLMMLGIGLILPLMPALFYDTPLFNGHSFSAGFLIGLLLALFPLAQFFGAPVLGALSDRYGRKPLLLLSLFGSFLGYVLFALGIKWNLLWLLFCGRLLDGITGGNIAIIRSSFVDISSSLEEKTRYFGYIGIGFGVGFILGPFFGGILSDPTILPWFSLITPFLIAALLILFAFFLTMKLLPETLKERHTTPVHLFVGFANLKKAFMLKKLRFLFLALFILFFGWSFHTQFFQFYLFKVFAFTPRDIGILFAYLGLWIIFTQGWLLPKLIRYFSSELLVRVFQFIIPFILLSLLIPHQAWWFYVLLPFLAMTFGVLNPSYSVIISNHANAKNQGAIMGIQQSLLSLAQGIPPLFGGIALIGDVRLPLVLSAFFIFSAGLIYLYAEKQEHEIFS